MFVTPVEIEQNVARIERQEGEYHIVLTVKRCGAETISPEEVEIVLAKVAPPLFKPRFRFGGKS